MSQRPHERAAELHNLAAHAHAAAAVAHGKEDHLTAHELSKQAQTHARVGPENSAGSRQENSESGSTAKWSLNVTFFCNYGCFLRRSA